jgi:hypothetical protein
VASVNGDGGDGKALAAGARTSALTASGGGHASVRRKLNTRVTSAGSSRLEERAGSDRLRSKPDVIPVVAACSPAASSGGGASQSRDLHAR